jgi:hypothetical protein
MLYHGTAQKQKRGPSCRVVPVLVVVVVKGMADRAAAVAVIAVLLLS